MSTFRGIVTIDHPALGGTGTNTWHVRTTGSDPLDAGELQGLTDIIEAFYTGLEPILAAATHLAFDGVWTSVGANPQVNTTDADAWTITSTGSDAPLPPADCVCVTWRTTSASRSGRGRTFLGPMGVGSLQGDGTVEATRLASLREFAGNLVDASTGFTNGAIGVFSTKNVTFRDFVGSSITDQFAVLRSRRD